jgi:pyruvate/2-oxoglutarate dehydrogenase complex dihydrolipoamide dehydrogenase (E3) component
MVTTARIRAQEAALGHPFDFDLVVIGGGIAGFVSAVTANGLGKRVAIVEERRAGGNCTSFTCIPSKALVRAGHVAHLATHLDRVGLGAARADALDTSGVMARVRSVIQRAYAKDLPETFERIGIRVISGRARFLDRHRIQVDGRRLSAERFIIATGTRPFIPPIPGLDAVPYLTNETLYELDRLPRSFMILGGGADGLEYASALQRLGVQVTVLQRGRHLLAEQDREMVRRLEGCLREAGVSLLAGIAPLEFAADGGQLRFAYRGADGVRGEARAEALLVTVGRQVAVEGLDLEKAGVRYTRGGVATDATLRTSAPHIYACGDVVGPYQLASMAEYQGILAATNAFLPVKRRVDYSHAAFVLFTEPTLAYMGMTEEAARKRYGGELRIYRLEYRGMRRAMVDGEEDGAAKFICDRRGRLVGVHILGQGAAEVIHEAQIVKALGLPLRRLNAIPHAYPTYAQALVGRAAQLAFLDHMAGSLLVNQALRILPGLRNRLSVARRRLAEAEDHGQAGGAAAVQAPGAGAGCGASGEAGALHLGSDAWLIRLPRQMTRADEPLLSAWPPGDGALRPQLVLDFSEVERMNGLGALALAKLFGRGARAGQRPLVVAACPHYRDVLRLTGLERAAEVCESWEAVRDRLGAAAEALPPPCGPPRTPGDLDCWARPVGRLQVGAAPGGAMNLNVQGRRLCGAVEGFGRLWQKTYSLRIRGLDMGPEALMEELRANFSRLQAPCNRFYVGEEGIRPGAAVLIDARTPGGPLSTGVMVMFADKLSFSLITPQGHPESGWMTFTAFRDREVPTVQIVGFGRASDPLYEVAYRAAGSRIQVRTWTHVLASLAEHLGVQADLEITAVCVDPAVQWAKAGNLWHNAQVRTLLSWPRVGLGSGRVVRLGG